MNSNSKHAATCRKLKSGITIPPPGHPDAKLFVEWGSHPEDMAYGGPTSPANICKNRYCPDRGVRHDTLIRGYCEPCASIRVPPKQYKRANRTKPDDCNTIDRLSLPRD